jgi:integrase
MVRSWRASLIEAGHPGPSTIAKSYRLLHSTCATALEDGLINRNPCVIKGASVERPAERPVAMIEQVHAIADAIEPRYRAMVLLATFCGLRVGELRALRQVNLDLLHRDVAVVEQYQQLGDGTLVLGPPKTDAGRRKVAIPEVIISDLEAHLSTWCQSGRDNLVSPERVVDRSARPLCTRRGTGHSRRQQSRACASTIFVTPATRSPRRRARAPRNSWRGWAMRRRERR